MRPSRPTTTFPRSSEGSEKAISSGTVNTVTSTVTASISDADRGGNLGSWHAARADSMIVSPRGIDGSGYPMHPRRSPDG